MFTVKFSQDAIKRVDSYTDRIVSYYEDLYEDTGMGHAEEIIRLQYRDAAELLNISIYDTVAVTLEKNPILGYSYNPDSQVYTITATVGTRRLFIEYREYKEENTRVVMDVQVIRK
jgi:hypothetical protein